MFTQQLLIKIRNKFFPDEITSNKESEFIYNKVKPRLNIKTKKIIIVSTPKG